MNPTPSPAGAYLGTVTGLPDLLQHLQKASPFWRELRAVCFDVFGTLLTYQSEAGADLLPALNLPAARPMRGVLSTARRPMTAHAAHMFLLQREGVDTTDYARLAMTSRFDDHPPSFSELDVARSHFEQLSARLPGAPRLAADTVAVLATMLVRELGTVRWIESVSAQRLLAIASLFNHYDPPRLGVCSNLAAPFAIRVATLLQAVIPATQQVLSSNVGYVKPDPMIYQIVADRLGVRASDILFVGDKQLEDVAGPIAYGMRAAQMVRR